MTWQRVCAGAAAALTAMLLAADLVVVTFVGSASSRWSALGALALGLGSCALGLLVVRRESRNAAGTMLCVMGALWSARTLSDTYVPRQDDLVRLPDALWLETMTLWVWLYVAVALLILVFPTGRLLGPRWRLVVAGLVGMAVCVQAVMPLLTQDYEPPYDRLDRPAELSQTTSLLLTLATFPAFVVLLALSGTAAWLRYRRGDVTQRAQLKWFAAVVVVTLPLTLALSWVGYWVFGTHSLAGYGIAMMYAGLPLVTSIAILRHDLYDVDRALAASVIVGAVTILLVVVFGAASVATGVLLGRSSAVVAAGVTAVVVLLLAPLLGRLRRLVDQAVYPLRFAALNAVARLRAGIHDGTAEPEELQAALRSALGDPGLRVELVPGGGVPIVLGGRPIGALASTTRVSPRLLREVAASSAELVEMARLRAQSVEALQEAESGRARLQEVGYAERRRLERDLHDGAQQRLISLGLSLRLAQQHLADGTVDVDDLIQRSVSELATAVAELRRLAHGIRPSCLDDGLDAALRTLAESSHVPVVLSCASDHDLPDPVATTAYFIAAEALSNAVKHSGARQVSIDVSRDDASLHVRIADDGGGGAVLRPRSGLAGIDDRVAAAGGRLTLASGPTGTTVEAVLPCVS
jgi:signal transduction histidine kinase